MIPLDAATVGSVRLKFSIFEGRFLFVKFVVFGPVLRRSFFGGRVGSA